MLRARLVFYQGIRPWLGPLSASTIWGRDAKLKKLALAIGLMLAMSGLGMAQDNVLPEWLSQRKAREGKILVTFNKVPTTIDYELIGPIDVYARWFGSNATARALLAERARAMGANAVVETMIWQAPSFPVPAAPHAYGVAVRIPDIWDIERLADKWSSWE